MKQVLLLVIFQAAILLQTRAQEVKWKGKSVDVSHGKLLVDSSRRHLVFEDGTPFPYFGDTAWELFHRLNKAETQQYLESRRAQGFSVIQAVILAELDGLSVPTPEGFTPLTGNDPLRPNEAYFAHVDWVVQQALKKGLYMGILPTWGDKVDKQWGKGPEIFNAENAFGYGKFLGERYKDQPNIIWIIGGDRQGGGNNLPIWESLANGIRSADRNHLMTFHPLGERSSAEWFHGQDWLDFNMVQTGHSQRSFSIYQRLFIPDYERMPIKPIIDGEPRYENHPVKWKPDQFGWFDDADVRQALYWALFSGGFGHTYGCHSVWQMLDKGREPVGLARSNWKQDLDLPGARDIIHARNLLQSRPLTERRPFQQIIQNNHMPETDQFVAARGTDYVFIYFPTGLEGSIDLSMCGWLSARCCWYNPRTGKTTAAGVYPAKGIHCFAPPSAGRGNDWVLVLDNSVAGFSRPGKR